MTGADVVDELPKGLSPKGFVRSVLGIEHLAALVELPVRDLIASLQNDPRLCDVVLGQSYDKRYTPSTFVEEKNGVFRVGWYSNRYEAVRTFSEKPRAIADYLLFSFGKGRLSVSSRQTGDTMSVKGSCLCGGIRYEVDGGFGRVVNCHCSMCRKATGAAFRTRAAVRSAAFHWLAGEELVSRYESSPGETRTFCRVCGATLATFFGDDAEEIGLPLGTLDDDPGVRPTAHVFVNSKAAWFEITDGLPQFSERSPRSAA